MGLVRLKGLQLRADGYRDIYFEQCEPTDAETIQEAFGFVLDRIDEIANRLPGTPPFIAPPFGIAGVGSVYVAVKGKDEP